ncbi:transmembrane 220 family protein [Pedobacter jamesrossensis]|uniref:Transmembrane 220 family protein n=1 Tax=Pedobacter jamesrossensis TaxID=1908238 RepID=A0ABV8NMJ0_9SPHI
MKAFNLLFCILFIFSAALQYNDPDPYIWVPIYLYGAWLCYQAYRAKYYPKAYLAGIFIFAIYALFLYFDKTGVLNWYQEHRAENIVQSMKATKPWIEETREFGGLLILIIALAINYFAFRKNKL